MQLTEEQLSFYHEQGYLLIPGCFPRAEMETLRAELPKIFAEDSLRRVVEKNRNVVRSVYGSHLHNETFDILSRHPRLVLPTKQILDSDVYVYQFKVNAKASFNGDVWEWHQDYIFWRREDGMPQDRVTSVAIFIDDVTEFNGPLFLIPGSHREGMIENLVPDRVAGKASEAYQGSPAWINNLTADLKYSLNKEIIAKLVDKYGIVSPKGPSGSILFFHGNLVHGSTNNISPFDRVAVIVTFNSTENVPVPVSTPRPEFLVSRDPRPITPVSDNALLSLSRD